MKLYQLHSKQAIPTTKDKAWEFLSNPNNLATITPDHMDFSILTGADRPMFPGQIIQYKVSPFPGYSAKWVTEITHMQQEEYFVDEQRFGPYSLWHHKHFINPIQGGVEMEDVIDLKLPFGFLGQLVYPLIKKQLIAIFMYREDKLSKLFGKIDGIPNSLVLKEV